MQDGKILTELGAEADPWLCTATLKTGLGQLLGNTTVPFIRGVAEFSNLIVSKMDSDNVLSFAVTYPVGTALPSVDGVPFDVGPRPLGLKFDAEELLRKENTTFDMRATIWDEALDMAAVAGVLANYQWECSIQLRSGPGNLTGNTAVTVAKRKNAVVFSDLVLSDMGTNYALQAACFSADTQTNIIAIRSVLSPPAIP